MSDYQNLSTASIEDLEKPRKTTPHTSYFQALEAQSDPKPMSPEFKQTLEDFQKAPIMFYTSVPTIKFLPLHKDFKLPTKAREGDACFDLIAHTMEVKDGYIHYGLGCSVELPEGWQALLFPRSSISNMDLVLTNSVGVVDSGYRGELGARFKIIPPVESSPDNIPSEFAKTYKVGDRVCQIQFLPLPQYTLELVEELTDSQRGVGGFGSSGK